MTIAPVLNWKRPQTYAEWQIRMDRAQGGWSLSTPDLFGCILLQIFGMVTELYFTIVLSSPDLGLFIWTCLVLTPMVWVCLPWIRDRHLPRDEEVNLKMARVSEFRQKSWRKVPGTLNALASIHASTIPLLNGDVRHLDYLVDCEIKRRVPKPARTKKTGVGIVWKPAIAVAPEIPATEAAPSEGLPVVTEMAPVSVPSRDINAGISTRA